MDRRQERDHRREVHQQELGRTVKELYEARNLTQQEFADKIHRLRQFLTRLESGRDVKVTLDVIEDLADALEVQATELLESFIRRSATKRTFWVTVPKADPRLERHGKALSRLSRAAARVPVAEIETLAKWAEARSGTAKVAEENLVLGR